MFLFVADSVLLSPNTALQLFKLPGLLDAEEVTGSNPVSPTQFKGGFRSRNRPFDRHAATEHSSSADPGQTDMSASSCECCCQSGVGLELLPAIRAAFLAADRRRPAPQASVCL
ncbi:hypothetical protein GCM10009780_53500 [Actinomadura alba]